MPTYEYECTACGQHIEVFQRISEEPLTVCGVCGGALRKVFHPVGIVFKGSGFYTTDSRSKAKSAKTGSEAGSSTSKSSSEGSKSSSDGSSTSEGSSSSSEGSSSSSSDGSAAKKPASKDASSS